MLQKNWQNQLYIGTSGWNYPDWEGVLYPERLRSIDQFAFYAQRYSTVEINYTFHHIPKVSTVEAWEQVTPPAFRFTLKVHQTITREFATQEADQDWEKFIASSLVLKDKLAVILFQFPAMFTATPERVEQFKNWIGPRRRKHSELCFAFEFRHPSWLNDVITRWFAEERLTWVIAQSSMYPTLSAVTSQDVYLRLHGPGKLYASAYTQAQLEVYRDQILDWVNQEKRVFVYFNNTMQAHAVRNSRTLAELITGHEEAEYLKNADLPF